MTVIAVIIYDDDNPWISGWWVIGGMYLIRMTGWGVIGEKQEL